MSADSRLLRRVWQAINAAEIRLCGDAAVVSPSIAEGLAIAGRRAARLIDPWRDEVALDGVSRAWVDHRILRNASQSGTGHAFELRASTAQQAIDHCLVAHRLAARIQRPGLCTIDSELAQSIAAVQLPEPGSLDSLPAVGVAEDPAVASRQAFAEISRLTGRLSTPLTSIDLDGATSVLIATDSDGPRAERLAARRRQSGQPWGAVVLALIRPFPVDDLRRVLSGIETVVLLSDELRIVGEILGPAGPRIERADAEPADTDSVAAEGGETLVIGALPSDALVENLLLDSVRWLARSPVELRADSPGGLLTLTVGGRCSRDAALDLLFVSRPGALADTALLRRVREGGTVLFRSTSEEPRAVWASLPAEQRQEIVRRRIRLGVIAPPAVDDVDLQGAILAAAVGRQRIDPTLDRGIDAVALVDPSRFGEPASPPQTAGSRLPRMPLAPQSSPDSADRNRLRRFHVTGRREPGAPAHDDWHPAVVHALATPSGEPAALALPLFSRWDAAVLADRRRRRALLVDEARHLAETLGRTIGTPAELEGTLGQVGAELLDQRALAENLAGVGAAGDVDDETERRSAVLVRQLRQLLEELASRPIAYLLRSSGARPLDVAHDVQRVTHEDGLRAAIGLFDGLADQAVDWARTLRSARLEVESRFDAAVHGPLLERLDRQSLTAEELLALPVVVVLEQARRLRGPALAAFSEALRAGRPIQMLITEFVTDPIADSWTERSGYDPGLGYLAVAHREALVVQSSEARPEHLEAGLACAARSLDPVVVLAAAVPDGPEPLRLEAAVQSRATPCFVYDPSGGASWAERFVLEANPQPERSWPVHSVPYTTGDEGQQALDQPLTYADAVALDPVARSQFLVIEPESWSEEQVEIGPYLEMSQRERARRLPYIWVVRDGTLSRAIISWSLAFGCRDRARAWRILQELAGTDNAYASRAGEEARLATQQESDRKIEKLEADFAIALESERARGAREAVGKIVGLLGDPRGFQQALAMRAGSGGLTPVAVQPALQPQPIEEPPSDAPALAPVAQGPSIDSFLCTTCNECINLNSRMFRYNSDKQAEIADPAAGTFKELVKAAEVCPARCIHPGAPRAGDSTASTSLIERAAKFN